MNLNKKFLLGVSLCAVAATFAVACDDAESGGMTGTAGASGSTTGKAGTGGSGTAGKAGAGGASAGTGGSTTAGTGGTTTAGKGGTGGTAGKGGATGGSSGIGGSGATAGAAGSGATAGAAGAGGAGGDSGAGGAGGDSGAGGAGGDAGAGGAGGDSGAGGAGGDAGAGGGGGSGGAGGSGGTGMAALSVAHLSVDAGDVKICAGLPGQPQSIDALATFTGGGLTKLSFRDVTAHIQVPPGSYDFSIVDASETCPSAAPIATLSNITVEADMAYTVMAIGMKAGIQVRVVNDTTTSVPTMGLARFVHAASGLPIPVDVGAMMPAFTKLWTNAAYPGVAMTVEAPFTADANGYVTVPPMGYTIGVGASPAMAPTFVTTTQVLLDSSEIATLYAIDDAGGLPMGMKCHEAPVGPGTLLLSCDLIKLAPPGP